jgi:ATP-binding cassette subfamily B protein
MALLPLPLVSISVRYFGAAIHKRFEAIQEQLANLSAIVQEALAGVRVVRAYNQEAHEIERFRAANLEFVRRNRVLIRLQGLFLSEHDALSRFRVAAGSLAGEPPRDSRQLTLGEFVAFNSYLVMLSWPMIAFRLGDRTSSSEAWPLWKRMLEVLDAVPGRGRIPR